MRSHGRLQLLRAEGHDILQPARMWSVAVLVVLSSSACLAQYYEFKDVKVEVVGPQGLRVSIPDEPGIQIFAFHGNVNKELDHLEAAQMSKDVVKAKDGRWVFEDKRVRLKPGDVIYYWLYVQADGLGYRLDDQKYTVGGIPPGPGPTPTPTATPTPSQPPKPPTDPVTPSTCEPSVTVVSGKQRCRGEVIFQENFDSLDSSVWQHDVRVAKGPDFEFVVYNRMPENSYIKNGVLYIKPTLTEDIYGEGFVMTGDRTLAGCTGTTDEECKMKAFFANINPPVMSSRLRTINSFSFRYGKIQARAKMAAGDWIMSILSLQPRENYYGKWYQSGQIRLASSHGNRDLKTSGIFNLGVQEVFSELLLSPEEGDIRKPVPRIQFEKEREAGWNDDFHLFEAEWTPDKMAFRVDGDLIGEMVAPDEGIPTHRQYSGKAHPIWELGTKMAPFDREFFLQVGVSAGGFRDFPEVAVNSPNPKPWKDWAKAAMLDFWEKKNDWYRTWNPSQNNGEGAALQIDYIRVMAL